MKTKIFALLILTVLTVSLFASFVPKVKGQSSDLLDLAGSGWSLGVVDVATPLQAGLGTGSGNLIHGGTVGGGGSVDDSGVSVTTVNDSVSDLTYLFNSFADVPRGGNLSFDLSLSGLTLYKQLPLTIDSSVNMSEYTSVSETEAINNSQVLIYRPVNVVDGFACYNSTGAKVMEIYRSQLTDSNGSSVWLDMDYINGQLIVYLPLDWLSGAVYPVTLDPEFGYTSVGSTQQYVGQITVVCPSQFVQTGSLYLYGMTFYVAGMSTGDFSCGLYNPEGILIYSTNTYVASSDLGPIWISLQFPQLEPFISGTYYLSVSNENDAWFSFDYDSLITSTVYYVNGFLPSSINSPFETHANEIMSIYCNVVSVPISTPSPSATSLPVSTGSSTFVMLFAVCIIFLIVDLLFIFVPMAWVSMIIGMVSFAFTVYSMTTNLPGEPWFGFLMVLCSIFVMCRSAGIF